MPSAPVAEASVGVAMPAIMEPSTATMTTTGGTSTAPVSASFWPNVGSLSTSRTRGPSWGRTMQRITM